MSHVLLVNPRRRKRRKARATKARRRRARKNPIVRIAKRSRRRSARRATFGRVRRFRRNPIGGSGIVRDLQSSLVPVAAGAGGALVADIALGFLPVPESLKTPMLRPVVRSAAAIGVGVIAGMFLGKDIGKKVMAGGLTVIAYDLAKGLVQQAAPTLQLGCAEEFPDLPFLSGNDTPMLLDDGVIDDNGSDMGLVFDQASAMGEVFETY